MAVDLSIIVPLYNEAENIAPLHEKIRAALETLGKSFEILLVDDGSTDGTADVARSLAASDPQTKLIRLRRNFGQTAAMMAGFYHAEGEILIPMDGDGQNDPVDIQHLLAKLEEGYDVVSGWRKDRKDPRLSRTLISRVANRIISRISGVPLRDYGCTLKVYRRDILEDVRIYGEMHRFIPIYARWQGARVTELPVKHHPRLHGTSKYGLDRTIKVLLDLIVIRFLERYASNPIYLFGTFGILSLLGSVVAGLYAVWLKLAEGIAFITTPMPLLVVLLFIVGVMGVLMGLLAEMIMRTYFESQRKASYSVRERINL